MTQRKDILDALQARLALIQPANGYASTVVTVARQRDTEADPFAAEELPAINIRDQRAGVLHNVSDDEHTLPVTLDILTTGQIFAADAELLLGDVIACLASHDQWGGYADGTTIESHEIDISQTGDIITAGTIDIIIHYTTEKGQI